MQTQVKQPASLELPREHPKRLLDAIEETSEKMRKDLVRRLDGQRQFLLSLRLRCLETKKSFTRARDAGLEGRRGPSGRKKTARRLSEEWDDTPLTLQEGDCFSESSSEESVFKGRKASKPLVSLDLTGVTPAPLP